MSITTREAVTYTLYSTSAALTAGFTSTSFNKDFMSSYAVLAKITINTTTSSVVMALEASIDGTNYKGIDGSTTTVSSTGLTMWEYRWPAHNYVRMFCTATTANFNATITARSLEL